MQWSANINTSCVFCQEPLETVSHLFFQCPLSEQVWSVLAKGVMRDSYTTDWEDLMRFIKDETKERLLLFTTRYLFQATIHSIWRERNRRRHGDVASPPVLLAKLIDKTMRNKFSIIQRRREKKLEGGLQFWFSTR